MIYQVACLILFSVSDALAGYHERIELFSSLAPRKEDEIGKRDGNSYLIGIMNGEINPLFIFIVMLAQKQLTLMTDLSSSLPSLQLLLYRMTIQYYYYFEEERLSRK